MFTLPVVLAVLRRPSLWLEAGRAAVALAPRRWWSRFPFLPRPDHDYLQWRLATAYGTAAAPIAPQDVISYLRWRRTQRVGGSARTGEA